MQCPKCSADNRKGAAFCAQCGAPLVRVCARCGAEVGPDARFCDACGAPLGAPPPDPLAEALKRLAPKEYAERLMAASGEVGHERRLVTILLSDIKGSSAIAPH
jgi:predicted amidophosphoribosyltransferase